MTNAIKWITEAIIVLSNLNIKDVSSNSIQQIQLKKLKARNSDISSEVRRFNVTRYDKITDCSKKNARSANCDLHKLIKENKCVFEEFTHTPSSKTSLEMNTISVLTYSRKNEEGYACLECYCKQQLLALIDLLPVIPIEIEIPMTSLNRREMFYILGLSYNTKEDINDIQNIKSMLGFTYKVKEKDINSSNEVDVEKFVIISTFQKNLNFLHLEKIDKSSEYLVNKNYIVPYVASNDIKIKMFPISSILYANELNILINIGSRYNTAINEAFSIAENISDINKEVREFITKEVKPIEKKTPEKTPPEKVPVSFSFVNSTTIINWIFIFIIMAGTLYLFHNAFKATQTGSENQRQYRPTLL
ncbi:hypothetical protein GINT2_000824 [Glugoides intestinalis]